MSAVIMNGTQLRDDIVAELRAEIEAAGSPPVCLATVLVGDDKPSQIYVRSKQKKAAEAGMQSRHVAIDGNVSQAELEDTVAALVADPGVHGILCQLPLPGGLEAEPLLRMIPPRKTSTGLTEASLGRLVRGQPGHVGCTPLGVMRLLERYNIPTVRQARRRGRPLDIGGSADGAAARPQGRRRHRHPRPLAHRRPGRRVPRRPTSSSPLPGRRE